MATRFGSKKVTYYAAIGNGKVDGHPTARAELRAGYVFEDANGHTLMAWHEDGGRWQVDDPATGRMVYGRGTTRKAIVEDYDRYYADKFDKATGEGWYSDLRDTMHRMVEAVGQHGCAVALDEHRMKVVGLVRDGHVVETWDDATKQEPEPEPEPDAEPVEVVETPPAEAYADVDAGCVAEGPEEPEAIGPHHRPGTRPDRFCKAYGAAYQALYDRTTPCDEEPDRVFDGMQHALMLAGEAFMREHPRMLCKFAKWRGDIFTSDREVAALGWVALEWMDAERQDSRAA